MMGVGYNWLSIMYNGNFGTSGIEPSGFYISVKYERGWV